jgi:hypothetical protein
MLCTKHTVVHALMTNPLAVEKALVMLYDRQTEDEQSHTTTKHDNRRGFNTAHAKRGSYLAKWIKSGRRLTGRFVDEGRQIALYYAGTQLLAAAKVKAARKAEAA